LPLCGQLIGFKGVSVDITGSGGLARMKISLDAKDTLIASADRALYEAKAKGRNRIEYAVVE